MLTLSFCGGVGGGCKVIFMSNPTVVLRLGWGFDNNFGFSSILWNILLVVKLSQTSLQSCKVCRQEFMFESMYCRASMYSMERRGGAGRYVEQRLGRCRAELETMSGGAEWCCTVCSCSALTWVNRMQGAGWLTAGQVFSCMCAVWVAAEDHLHSRKQSQMISLYGLKIAKTNVTININKFRLSCAELCSAESSYSSTNETTSWGWSCAKRTFS